MDYKRSSINFSGRFLGNTNFSYAFIYDSGWNKRIIGFKVDHIFWNFSRKLRSESWKLNFVCISKFTLIDLIHGWSLISILDVVVTNSSYLLSLLKKLNYFSFKWLLKLGRGVQFTLRNLRNCMSRFTYEKFIFIFESLTHKM